MKVINGKLFGQANSDLEVFKEQIERRCDRLEITLSSEQQQQVKTYKQGLEKVYYLQQVLGRQIQDLETTQVDCLEKILIGGKQDKSTKLLWLTFSTSLVIGLITVVNLVTYESIPQCQVKTKPIQTSFLKL